MWSTAREISPGDTVVIWMTRDIIQPIVVTPGKDINNRFGYYKHSDLIGIPYGSKVGSRNGKGFVHVLRPTPELWTMALPHRTQILYLADIAFITSYLNIKRGSKVIEAGTGSGSFSHSVARTVGTSGHLWTYEFHEARANKAGEEFAQHGLNETVTLTHRNVCKDGFTIVDKADAVFLDLPAPWDAVEHARRALRKDKVTRICCFSPCIEQVLRTVSALNETGFVEITMYETLQRPHEVSQISLLPSVKEAAGKLKQSEQRREEKRLRQIAQNKAKFPAAGPGGSKRKRDEHVLVDEEDCLYSELAPQGGESSVVIDDNASACGSTKKLKTTDIASEDDKAMSALDDGVEYPGDLSHHISSCSATAGKMSVSKVITEVRGHTSYLTFASLLPIPTGAVIKEEPGVNIREEST
ncbi:hypothetical protein M378DRAFT_169842 [Amanita muscaria Koide BX008]|uniref:tRNA (adenine(58)-N(1))-methyltransferase catalytic subunit TRM61 n=1 Tax=Amanita muscaria (strain Koide BX008) TaxID=946122 RepID=A0A0C2SY73_AMAMK|nr:hypothetical protein M378DRAFT_169842 [Amanita muscaria Koide BX008]